MSQPSLTRGAGFLDEVLATYVRSGVIESEHRGDLIILSADGSVLLSRGNIDHKIFPRSTIKAIQTAAMVRNGLDLEPHLLALVSSSHSGAQMHLDGVLEILAKAQLTQDDLQNAAGKPLGDAERRAWDDKLPAPLAMNCSGKHAGMLMTCVINGWSTHDYLDPTHPLQRACKQELEELANESISLTSTDGCGAPLFLLSVHGLARAIRTLTISADPVHCIVVDACRTFPEMVAGEARLTTQLMREVPGLFMKEGAEGVEVISLPDGHTIVFKISDGSIRAFRVLAHATLAYIGVTTRYEPEPVLGGKSVIGAIAAAFI